MISRRQYFSIVLIFLATFLLFQGTQLGREYWGSRMANIHASETGLRSADVWSPEDAAAGGRSGRIDSVLLVGDPGEAVSAALAQWALYAKLRLVTADALPASDDALPALILIGGDELAGCTDAARSLLERGTDIVCLTMPPLSRLEEDAALRELLGIQDIRRRTVTLGGLHLFDGFLLGGERIYVPEDGDEAEKRQDLPLDTAWYIVRTGCETFLQGVLSDEDAAEAERFELQNEDAPAIIWRHHCENGEVFVVNGPYMADRAVAAGIMQAIMARISDVCLYPVMDAQLFSLLDYPALSNENDDVMQALYGRGMTDVTRNIILQDLISLPNRYGFVFTAFAAVRLDYTDGVLPREGVGADILSSLRSLDSELGLSLRRAAETALSDKLEQDGAYFASEDIAMISAAFADPDELILSGALASDALAELRTVLADADGAAAPLGYLADNVTLQRLTSNALSHTYAQDLELLGWETALGYDSCGFDLSPIWSPVTDGDTWQIAAERAFSDLITYRAPFTAFDRVTASECDAKIRRFLRLDYDYARAGDDVTLLVEPFNGEASFVLRLHDETVDGVEGGEWTEIEDGAFLIRAAQERVVIHVTTAEPIAALTG